MLLVCPPGLSFGGIWYPALWVAFMKSMREVGSVKKKCRACESLACANLGDVGVE